MDIKTSYSRFLLTLVFWFGFFFGGGFRYYVVFLYYWYIFFFLIMDELKKILRKILNIFLIILFNVVILFIEINYVYRKILL